MRGYIGKILWVNLSTGEISDQHIPDEIYERLLSGVGLGAYILYNQIPSGADPLGPDNILGLVSGLLTGTGSVMTSRWMVVCKSPLTGGWGDSNCGGTFAPAIKQCGYDGIFFTGISPEPVYLFIDHKGPQLKPAGHVWGQDATRTEEILTQENGGRKKPAVAAIGQAGEKLSLISGICNDGGRIAARSGVGAVMGSKRLKAVVLAGAQPVGCQNPAEVKAISQQLANKIRKQNLPGIMRGGLLPLGGMVLARMSSGAPLDGMITVGMMKKWGTVMNNGLGLTAGDSPVKNWGGSVKDFGFSAYRHLDADRVTRRETQKYSCDSCILGCGGICDIRDLRGGEFSHTHKPEYETCCAFGPLVLNKDLDAIFYINELLNRAGMDSISAGSTVAFAIECFEKGLLTREVTGGLELTWGNANAIIELIKKMITREGIGELLADGVKAAAERIGQNAGDYAMHAGGQEAGMHDTRYDPVLSVHYSADPTPGRHTIGASQYYDMIHLWDRVSWAPKSGLYAKAGEYLPSEKLALKTVANSCYKELVDGAGGCLFGMIMGVDHWKLFEWLNAATGWGKSPDEYMLVGKRIQTLRQLFNIKHGIDPHTFRIPKRMAGEPPLSEGPLKGKQLPVEEMLRLHWKCYGWDENSGVPLESTLAELHLESLITQG